MVKIKEAIVVEGRYDKNTLSQIVDAPIFETAGFGIMNDPKQLQLLRKNLTAILVGIASGVMCSGISIFAMALLFGLNHTQYVTLLPKSITTAIGIGLSAELNGYVAITVSAIIFTGLIGNIAGGLFCRLLHIKHPIAKGVAIGTASHVMGTSKAMEIGEIEGAMSSLSVAVAGCMTVGAAILLEWWI